MFKRFLILMGLSALLTSSALAASTTFTVTSTWTKVGSSGDTVMVESRTPSKMIYLATASSPPATGALGIGLVANITGLSARFGGTLAADLYASCFGCGGTSAQLVVDNGLSGGGSGGGGGSVTQGTSPWVTSVTGWASGTLGAMAAYGTSPGAVLVPGVNAFVTNPVAVTGTFFQTTQPVSGTFWQATQPVSAASLPLPTGAATSALQSTQITTLGTPMQATGGTVGLVAGAAIVGKAGIDQTTDVTTNGVEVAPTAGAAAGITPVVSASAEGSHVLKGSAGNLYSVYATSGATAGYLMVFNATSAPADGAVTPVQCMVVQANSTRGLTFNSGPPESYATGITVVFSSTGCFTKTVSATVFFHGSVK